MKIFLIKQIIPLAAFGLAIAGAVGTRAESNSKTAVPIASFTKNLSGACGDIVHSCNTDNLGALCRVGGSSLGARLWAKDGNQNCVVEVYMVPPQ
jgi:hypothetical protein